MYKDYEDVAIDIYKDCKLHPIKASVYATRMYIIVAIKLSKTNNNNKLYSLVMGSCYYLAKHNPDEVAFREQLLSSASKVLQIGQPIRNPVTTYYLKWVEQCHNEGLIRRLNLGIFSVLWLHDFDKDCKIYKATCPYLKPRYLTFYTRIIDIGFLDNWWVLENSMINYDINETEFNENAYA